MEKDVALEISLPVKKVVPMLTMAIRVCEALKENLNFNEKSKVQIEYDLDEPGVKIKVIKHQSSRLAQGR